MNILVTGGAGYIGSFMTKALLDKGYSVVVTDNLSRGHKEAIHEKSKAYVGNLLDQGFVEKLFSENSFDAVIHFAGYISMSESMENPYVYFQNNVLASLNVLEVMRKHDVDTFIFSSTAGVYGNPEHIPIPENHPKNPTNPYGHSKLMVEDILKWYKKIHNINYVALRYFNASGAAFDGSMGEDHDPETHLIPNAILAALEKKEFMLFGDDYPTPDGTCVRDYIHVLDLVEAHVLALEKVKVVKGEHIYNVGTGKGYSNKDVLSMVRSVTGIDFPVRIMPRRPGDADRLIADSSKIQQELNFSPQYSDLKTIVESAWEWHKQMKK